MVLDDLETLVRRPSSDNTTGPSPPSFVTEEGKFTEGRLYAITRDGDVELALFQAFPFNRLRVFDIRSSYAIQMFGIATIEVGSSTGQVWRVSLSPLTQEVQDSQGEITSISPDKWVHKAVYIDINSGLMYEHAKVTFIQRDGKTRVIEGILKLSERVAAQED